MCSLFDGCFTYTQTFAHTHIQVHIRVYICTHMCLFMSMQLFYSEILFCLCYLRVIYFNQ